MAYMNIKVYVCGIYEHQWCMFVAYMNIKGVCLWHIYERCIFCGIYEHQRCMFVAYMNIKGVCLWHI